MKNKIIFYLIIIFAVVGILDTLLLGYYWASNFLPFCPVNGNGCFEVATSKYNAILGIPNFAIGLGGYILILILTIISEKKYYFKKLLLATSAIGFLFSFYFLYLQLFVIKAFCDWCVLSAITMTAIFVSSIIYSRKNYF